MDAVSAVARSVDAVNKVLQNAQQKTLEHAKKAISVSLEQRLGPQPGKVGCIDVTG
jgi:hypothetical protein